MKKEKHPVPLWLWGLGIAGLIAQQVGYQLTRHYELINALFVFFSVIWLIVYFRKREGL